MLKKLMFSKTLISKTVAKKIAYIAVVTAFTVVSNAFEFKFSDVQFSLTVLISILSGIILGAGSGFCACLIGDFLGYIINSSGYIYMFWVGLTTAVMAFISGVIFNNIKLNFKGAIIVKTIIVCLLTFLLGTILINTTGFYVYNKTIGFSPAVLQYFESAFGSEKSYLAYACYRFFFKGQIYNSLFNYGLAFIVIPLIKKLPFIKD
ncbi:MAG: ECF transporter S component [Clostridia bacterium]|nr:ECF transporter S component [Clostridia bacterium]